MPKTSINYTKARIYKLISPHTDKYYIGSCCTNLNKRMGDHKRSSRCTQYMKRRMYVHFNETGFSDVQIILIEQCVDVKNSEQLRQREQFYIDQADRSLLLNTNNPICKENEDDVEPVTCNICNARLSCQRVLIQHQKKNKKFQQQKTDSDNDSSTVDDDALWQRITSYIDTKFEEYENEKSTETDINVRFDRLEEMLRR